MATDNLFLELDRLKINFKFDSVNRKVFIESPGLLPIFQDMFGDIVEKIYFVYWYNDIKFLDCYYLKRQIDNPKIMPNNTINIAKTVMIQFKNGHKIIFNTSVFSISQYMGMFNS